MSDTKKDYVPYGRQDVSEDDIRAVEAVLRSDWLTQGPSIDAFEELVAKYCGAPYAVAVNSATSALHIACVAAGLGPGDVLWTVPNTFVASANCALYCGAAVDFVDIDPMTLNISVDELDRKLAVADKAGRLPKVVVPVHFAGQSCEMDKIKALGDRFGFTIIEDASHAIGGRYKESGVGSCEYSDMTVFSFHPVKIVTTGEGGMILVKNKDAYEKLKRLRSHGITRDEGQMTSAPDGPWYYQQIELGFNYRMTDIQAALGASQMRRIDEFVARRNYLSDRYDGLLSPLPLTLPIRGKGSYSACHLYAVRLRLAEIKKTRLDIFNEMRAAGIGVNVHYIPVHTQPYYLALGFKKGQFPNSEAYYEEAMSLPLYFGLSDEAQAHVAETLTAIL